MRIKVTHSIGDLASDLAAIPARMKAAESKVVRKNVAEGTRLAKGFAKAEGGPHGKHYHKRITGEMTGVLEGEFGPVGIPKSNFVGAGYRHGRNRDLLRSADIIGPKLADEVGGTADRMFW